jgi:hypothetical protein
MKTPPPPGHKGPGENHAAQAKRQELKSVLDEQLLDEIHAGLWHAQSYITSMLAACARGDRQELSIRRRQISSSLKHAFEAHTMLNGSAPK